MNGVMDISNDEGTNADQMSFDGVLAKDQEGGCNDIMLVDTKLDYDDLKKTLHDKWRQYNKKEEEERKNFHTEIGHMVCEALARIEKVGEQCEERSAEIHSRIEAHRSQVSIDQSKLDEMLTNTLPDEHDLRDVSRQTANNNTNNYNRSGCAEGNNCPPEIMENCKNSGGKPSCDLCYADGCNNMQFQQNGYGPVCWSKIVPTVPWSRTGSFGAEECGHGQQCVTHRCDTKNKLYISKGCFPSDEFDKKDLCEDYLNGTFKEKLCSTSWCNAEPDQYPCKGTLCQPRDPHVKMTNNNETSDNGAFANKSGFWDIVTAIFVSLTVFDFKWM